MTEISELFNAGNKPTDKIEAHFLDYRRMVDRIHVKNVSTALELWTEWQEVTWRLLLMTGKNNEYAEWKIKDAEERRAELPKIKERSKDRR